MTAPLADQNGYRPRPAGSGRIRADVIDVYVFRPCDTEGSRVAAVVETSDGAQQHSRGVEFLQVLRASEPLKGTWQPVMGHIEQGETAPQCAVREMREELGLSDDGGGAGGLIALWALDQVHPYYIAQIDSIVMSPRFAAQVPTGWEPRLNAEHTAARWVPWSELWRRFMWPGQVAACREITDHLLRPGSLCREALRIRPVSPVPPTGAAPVGVAHAAATAPTNGTPARA